MLSPKLPTLEWWIVELHWHWGSSLWRRLFGFLWMFFFWCTSQTAQTAENPVQMTAMLSIAVSIPVLGYLRHWSRLLHPLRDLLLTSLIVSFLMVGDFVMIATKDATFEYFPVIDNQMCINRLIIDNQIFIQHASWKETKCSPLQSGTQYPHGIWLR